MKSNLAADFAKQLFTAKECKECNALTQQVANAPADNISAEQPLEDGDDIASCERLTARHRNHHEV